MAVSVVPALIDALVSEARTAVPAYVKVYDGYGVSTDPGDYLMIGVEDPDNADAAFSAEVEQSWAHVNHTTRDEEGDVTCAALSWNGDGDQKRARDAVYAIAEALAASLRATPALGLANVLWTSYSTRQQLSQDQSNAGAVALLVFRIHFRARI